MNNLPTAIACLYYVHDRPRYVGLRSTCVAHKAEQGTDLHFPSLEIGVNFLQLEGFVPLAFHEVAVNDGSTISQIIEAKFLDVLPYSIIWFRYTPAENTNE